MKKALLRSLPVLLALLVAGPYAPRSRAQNPGPEELKRKVEAYVRYLFAFGPDVKLSIGEFKESGVPGLLETTIALTIGENKEDAKMWVSKDGKFLVRGEMSDMGKDGFAENRAKLDIKDAPSNGSPSAPITIVEFADFECPGCAQFAVAEERQVSWDPQALQPEVASSP